MLHIAFAVAFAIAVVVAVVVVGVDVGVGVKDVGVVVVADDDVDGAVDVARVFEL